MTGASSQNSIFTTTSTTTTTTNNNNNNNSNNNSNSNNNNTIALTILIQKNGANAGLVTMSRGSNVDYDPWVRRENIQSTLVPLQTAEEPKLEEVEETNDEDLKESIIYLPASNEDLDIEVAR